jgi:hypothetical protein
MLRRLYTTLLVLLIALGLPSSAFAQDYLFSLDKEVVHVYWNPDGTTSLDYTLTFTNQPGAHVIDFVDMGMPNGNFNTYPPRATATTVPLPGETPTTPLAGSSGGTFADVDGNPVSISSDYQGEGSYGFSVDMGTYAIQPGQSGTVHVYTGGITGLLHPDDNDEAYASAVFSPTWFGSQYVVGSTDLTVTFHLPPGVKPEEPRWHSSPSGFPSEPQTGLDSEGRVTYTWSNPAASGSSQYLFGASFPKSYVPVEAIYTPPPQPPINFNFDSLFPILCICFFAFTGLGMPIFTAIAGSRRKLQYMNPKIAIEGLGIKRGLTAVEAAILMEQPLDKVMTMILFGVVKKEAGVVTQRDPLTIEINSPQPEGLHEYEINFLKAFKEKGVNERRKALQDMVVALIKSVTEKMKGFSRTETISYYKRVTETAWEQVQKADTPEVQMAFFDKQLEWTMLDKNYEDRSRRVFSGPVYVPMWWGNYDPTYSSARPISTSGTARPAMPVQPAGTGRTSLPGADFAASVVTGTQTFSQKVIGNVNDFTSRVTNVTNPPPKPSASSYRGGGGGGCACACACAGCACACAGGGR